MTEGELKNHLFAAMKPPVFSPCAMISYNGERGIAYLIGETWSKDWHSGGIAVLWWNGDLTVLPFESEVLKLDAWS